MLAKQRKWTRFKLQWMFYLFIYLLKKKKRQNSKDWESFFGLTLLPNFCRPGHRLITWAGHNCHPHFTHRKWLSNFRANGGALFPARPDSWLFIMCALWFYCQKNYKVAWRDALPLLRPELFLPLPEEAKKIRGYHRSGPFFPMPDSLITVPNVGCGL